VDFQPNPNQSELSRLLVAADASIDPHRLVKLCCERAGRDPLSVSLLVPIDDKSRPRSESTGKAERLLRRAAALLDAAGVRLEDLIIAGDDGLEVAQLVRLGDFDALLVCAPHPEECSVVLPFAVRLAGVHGLAVLGSGRQAAGNASWLRRVLDPLVHWPRSGEQAS
jgi:nucleotide-binding universal stress UspA family protein